MWELKGPSELLPTFSKTFSARPLIKLLESVHLRIQQENVQKNSQRAIGCVDDIFSKEKKYEYLTCISWYRRVFHLKEGDQDVPMERFPDSCLLFFSGTNPCLNDFICSSYVKDKLQKMSKTNFPGIFQSSCLKTPLATQNKQSHVFLWFSGGEIPAKKKTSRDLPIFSDYVLISHLRKCLKGHR